MLVLWQWHSKTAYGEDAILAKARKLVWQDFQYHLALAALGPQKIENIEDAIQYFQNNELGVVKDEIQPNEIECEE